MKHLGRNTREARLISKYEKSGNEHIFYYWNSLNDKEKDNLIYQLSNIKLKKVMKYFRNRSICQDKPDLCEYTSADYLSVEERDADPDIKAAGVKALKSGEVAFLTVAGGQASRLGFEKPKGCFGISPINDHPLFRIFAEKIIFYSNYYNHKFKWFIMTSEDNYNDTKLFFEQNGHLGLSPSDVVFFKQGMLPTLTADGKMILREPHEIFMNPDGHGGILNALIKIGLIESMYADGIKYLSYFQVDNPLINMADPYMIGYHITNTSQVTTKVIKKAFPEEKLGSIVKSKKTNTNKIIEYSDMTPDMMSARKDNGSLLYEMGSIGIHIFNTDFIKKTTKKLPVHTANKTVTGIIFDENPKIGQIEGCKFETFVFDTIPLSQRSVFFETTRLEEFSPLKNATGVDSIETCLQGQIELYKSWLQEAGFKISSTVKKIEISPLYAPDREIFIEKSKIDKDKIQSILDKNGESIEIQVF